MKKIYQYFFVFRFHNLGSAASYDTRLLTIKEAREYYRSLCDQYDYVFMFKRFD